MERLTERLATARAALETLNELVRKPDRSKVERDAAIQRFEYTFEAVWKAAQLYLREVEGLDVGSPKRAARAALQVGLFDEAHARQVLVMVDDRNCRRLRCVPTSAWVEGPDQRLLCHRLRDAHAHLVDPVLEQSRMI